MSVLVVEDAPEFQTLIGAALSHAGFGVRLADDGESGVELARAMNPEVIVLDLGLPGIDGLEACRRMRAFTNAPVIMLTAKDEETDLLIGLAAGADDYMTKPFSPKELVARVQAIMRRPRAADPADSGDQLQVFGDIEIDKKNRVVRRDGDEVDLAAPEFDLLALLVDHPDMVFGRPILARGMWGIDSDRRVDEVDTTVKVLALKLDRADTSHISEVCGVGYRLTPL